MNKRRMLLLAVVVLAAFASGGCGYNTLVEKQQNVRRSWSDVESNLQRRADLVPNLVTAAKLYGFKEEPYFKAEEGAKQVPRIDPNVLRRDQGGQSNTK